MFISYAQNFEDVMLDRIFRNKQSGFYIDIGAHHPVYDSVTKSFYDRGWYGINIEPVKEFFELLQQQRHRDINLNIAISSDRGNLEFFELQGSGFSTLDGDAAMKLATERGLNLSQYSVLTQTLADVCQEYVQCPIDFLKIDVEGWEEQVILGNDWENFRPTVVIIEATLPGSPIRREDNILKFLQEKNYQHVYFDGLNDYYLDRQEISLNIYFNSPPNVFDNFASFKLLDLQVHANNLSQIIEKREKEIRILVNHLEDERFEVSRLNQVIAKLQKIKNEAIAYYQSKAEELQKDWENRVIDLQNQVVNWQNQLSEANQLVNAMETSKFWKIRKIWFRFRKGLGIKGD